MDNIEFEADKVAATTYADAPKKSAMVKLLMSLGIKEESTANYILIGASVLLLAVTAYIYIGIFSEPKVDEAAAEREALLMQVEEARQ